MQVTVSEFRNHFGAYLKRIEQGEEILIMRRGKPAALIVPDQKPTTPRNRLVDTADQPAV